MLGWGIAVVIVLLVVVAMAYFVVRLHLLRRHTAHGLRQARLALQQQSVAHDSLLMAACNFSDRLIQLVLAEVGIQTDSPSSDQGPTGSAPLPQPTGIEEGRGHHGRHPFSSTSEPRSLTSSAAERQVPGRHERDSATRRQRERQWAQVNVASETAAHVVPDPAGASVFEAVSGELLAGFHGSAVDAVSRERSRREESPEKSEREFVSGVSERFAWTGGIVEKSALSEIIDPRALWERETSYGAYGNLA